MNRNDIAPWDGPDLLADVKAAALLAGSSGTTVAPISAPKGIAKEPTWADFREKPMVAQKTAVKLPMRIRLTRSVKPRDASERSSTVSLGATAVPVAAPARSAAESEWWIRLRAENAAKAAMVASEKKAKKLEVKQKVALKRNALGAVSRRSRQPRQAVHSPGPIKLNNNGQPRKQRAVMTPALAAAITADTGTHTQIARRHGVSTTAVQGIRAGMGSRTARRLTAQQVAEIWRATKPVSIVCEQHGISPATVSMILNGKSWRHLTRELGPSGREPREA